MVRLKYIAPALAIVALFCADVSDVSAKQKVKAKPVAQVGVTELIIKRKYKAAFALLQNQANRGDMNAGVQLAELYRVGLGTAKNDLAARNWLQKAADAGNSKARLLLKRLDQNQVAATVKKTAGDTGSVVALANTSPDFSKLPQRLLDQPDWLTLAAARKNSDVVATLSKSNDIDKSNQSILAAVKNGDIQTTQQLLVRNAAQAADQRGQTALMLAVNTGNAELVNVVLQGKINLAAKNKSGKTALDIAAQTCQAATLAKLISSGAKIDEQKSSFQPLISIAQNCSNWPDFKLFFKAADVNATDALGRTAIWYAAAKGDVPLMAWLTDMGANLSLADKEGLTPLHAAASNNQPFALRYVLSKSDSFSQVSNRGTNPLMLAAASGCRECILAIIEKSADINFKNNDGDTALIYAVRARQMESASLLIDNGANADARNGSGDNANKLAELIGLTLLKGSTQ